MIPEHIKQKIKAVAEKQRSPFAYTVVAEFGYFLAQQEIERLKGLIENAHTRGWLDFPEDDNQERFISIESSWQQFKKDNQL